ncbi:MAG: FAD-dependent oxidoreductase [Deltaproteobacteria bacterium]|nr:FAD-dependent oxidoreductase [Deltaproteobacteria bacterium]
MAQKIIIIGAGPCGLGAAWRLSELGHREFTVLERNSYPGGLAASFTDSEGWTFDIGGHVIFSHYPEYDRILQEILGKQLVSHTRKAFIRTQGKWIPYPFQNNVRHLSPEALLECLVGLAWAGNQPHSPRNFKEWIRATFGHGIAKHFMEPYNEKVWGIPLELMDFNWISERVKTVDFEKIMRNVIYKKDDDDWGPNAKFSYPKFGGTGEIFRRMAKALLDYICYNSEVVEIDVKNKRLKLEDGSEMLYDSLINTMPLNEFVRRCSGLKEDVRKAAQKLVHNKGIMVGVGIRRRIRPRRSWVYFPDPSVPFYRVTYLTNYSSHVAPPDHTTFIAETTCRSDEGDPGDPVSQTVEGLVSAGLIKEDDKSRLAATWSHTVEYSYPIPSLDRNANLEIIHPELERFGILSRGRFGGWVYETGNTDHAVMMGFEAAEKLLNMRKETVFPFAASTD